MPVTSGPPQGGLRADLATPGGLRAEEQFAAQQLQQGLGISSLLPNRFELNICSSPLGLVDS